MALDVAAKIAESKGDVMAQEMEFVTYGVIILGVWVVLSVLTAMCWSLWSWKIGPPIDRKNHWTKLTSEQGETARKMPIYGR